MTKDKSKEKDLCKKSQQCDLEGDNPPTATDIYANTKYRKEDSNVAVPTKESVEEAKEWVDDENQR